MVDPALMADASATLLPALVGSPMAIDPHYDPHTLSNLGPDIFNTCVVAAVGLMGAYVTQGTEGFAETEAQGEDWRPRRRLQQLLPWANAPSSGEAAAWPHVQSPPFAL